MCIGMWVGIQYTWQATDEPALVMEQPGAHPGCGFIWYCMLSSKSCRLIEARSVSRDLFSECRGYRESSEAAPQGRQTAHRRRRLLRAACLDSSLEKDRHGMRQTRAMLPA